MVQIRQPGSRDAGEALRRCRAAGKKPWEAEREREEFEKSAGRLPLPTFLPIYLLTTYLPTSLPTYPPTYLLSYHPTYLLTDSIAGINAFNKGPIYVYSTMMHIA